ncbi:MAG: hypothetical protein M3137_01865 [Actinomycetota bacterium]|nr:hypothetical protein [Actinomycetota bacterium]
MEGAPVDDDLSDLNLVDLENELCRLPGVIMTRFVKGRRERPLGATLYVADGTSPEQLRTDVAAVAAVHFGVDLAPARMVIIEVGRMSVVSSRPADTTATGAAATIAPNSNTAATADSDDSQRALESAHQAVSTLLERLKAVTPEKDTVVVTDSDTVEAGPSNGDGS